MNDPGEVISQPDRAKSANYLRWAVLSDVGGEVLDAVGEPCKLLLSCATNQEGGHEGLRKRDHAQGDQDGSSVGGRIPHLPHRHDGVEHGDGRVAERYPDRHVGNPDEAEPGHQGQSTALCADWGHGPAQAVGRLQHPLDPEDLDEEQDERTVQGVAPVNHDASFY